MVCCLYMQRLLTVFLLHCYRWPVSSWSLRATWSVQRSGLNFQKGRRCHSAVELSGVLRQAWCLWQYVGVWLSTVIGSSYCGNCSLLCAPEKGRLCMCVWVRMSALMCTGIADSLSGVSGFGLVLVTVCFYWLTDFFVFVDGSVHFHVFTNSQVRQLEEQLRIMDQTLKALMAAEEKVLELIYLYICVTSGQV